MKRWLKWLGFVVAALVVAALGLVMAATVLYDRQRERVVKLQIKPVAVPGDEATLARGKYLFASRGCGDCHGPNGAGRVFIDAPDGSMRVRAPNISPGGVTAKYTEADWVGAIRHGVKPDGRPLFIMPSEDYNRFTDVDVAAIIAYARTLPAVPGGAAEIKVPLPVKAMVAFGFIQDAAAKIDHNLPPAQPVPEGVTLEHGRYVANMCVGCHGATLAGGPIPGGPPDWPPAANLTPGTGSVMSVYDKPEKFRAMFRSGKRPNGTAIAVMPFDTLRAMNDTDVDAIYLYLKSMPPQPFGQR
jgi:mono/diheme cytochrome c family protein